MGETFDNWEFERDDAFAAQAEDWLSDEGSLLDDLDGDFDFVDDIDTI